MLNSKPGANCSEHEDRLVLALRTEGLLDEPHKAFGRRPISALPINGTFAPLVPMTADAEAEADIDRVGEH